MIVAIKGIETNIQMTSTLIDFVIEKKKENSFHINTESNIKQLKNSFWIKKISNILTLRSWGSASCSSSLTSTVLFTLFFLTKTRSSEPSLEDSEPGVYPKINSSEIGMRFYWNRVNNVSKRGKMIFLWEEEFFSFFLFFSTQRPGIGSEARISVLDWRGLEENLVLGLDMLLNKLVRPKPMATGTVQKRQAKRIRDIWVLEGVEGQKGHAARINLLF